MRSSLFQKENGPKEFHPYEKCPVFIFQFYRTQKTLWSKPQDDVALIRIRNEREEVVGACTATQKLLQKPELKLGLVV